MSSIAAEKNRGAKIYWNIRYNNVSWHGVLRFIENTEFDLPLTTYREGIVNFSRFITLVSDRVREKLRPVAEKVLDSWPGTCRRRERERGAISPCTTSGYCVTYE